MAEHNELGKWGEDYATIWLRDKGYVIVERDWHNKHRDIDIIALDGNTMVFVEVRTRSSQFMSSGPFVFSQEKRTNVKRSIAHYLRSHHITQPSRFDLIIIIKSPNEAYPQVQHIQGFRLFP